MWVKAAGKRNRQNAPKDLKPLKEKEVLHVEVVEEAQAV